jgi:Acetyltransferase (GNAT) domain
MWPHDFAHNAHESPGRADQCDVLLTRDSEALGLEPGTDPHPDWRRLFNRPDFHALNHRSGQRAGYIEVHDRDGRLLGGLSGIREGDTFVSGFSAPFGGVDLVNPHETVENIDRVVQESLRTLRDEGVTRIQVRLPPAAYSANEDVVQFSLLNAGLQVERCELNQHIPIADWQSIAAYQSSLRPAAQKTLRHLMTLGLTFRPLDTDAEWDRAHELLAANRARKGRRMALSADYVKTARAQLGSQVRMYELTLGTTAVAAALVYQVTPGCDLVVAWGDSEHEFKRSPMILLAYHLVELALQNNVRILDLGISNEPERQPQPSGDLGLSPNFGLAQFKRTTLAQVQPRFTMTWTR